MRLYEFVIKKKNILLTQMLTHLLNCT